MQHDVTTGIATVRSASLTPSPRAAIRCLVVMGALCASAAAVLAVGASRAEAHPTGARDAALIGAPVELAALAAACGACGAGDAVACNDLGVSYEHGYSVESDSRIAATGCQNLETLVSR